MPSLKEYKTKLSTFKNTAKMTKTMKLVSASKLRQMFHAQSRSKAYAQELKALIARLAASVSATSHPLLHPQPEVKNVLVLLLTSDKGLCGSFNHNMNKALLNWINLHKRQYAKIDVSCCGKRGYMFFRNRVAIKKYYENVTTKPSFMKAEAIGQELVHLFLSGSYDQIYLAYNQFFNPLLQTPLIEQLLPIDPETLLRGGKAFPAPYIFEPKQKDLLEFLIPRYFYFHVYFALLENSAGEHGARMTAMDKASQNATELIELYTLLRNRARQAAITKELIEIVSGAEALK